MKLLSCYIENYGKINKRQINFSNGLTQFCQENGFGKTTLASFVKAMFYGLETTKANAKDFSDRAHFYPFNGGKFGGNLVFSYDNAEYKIERFFDGKSETKDTFRLYKNGLESKDFSNETGKEIFGLDKESFERTVFFDAGLTDIVTTGAIKEQLGNYMDGIGDTDLCTVLKNLEDKRKEYKALKGNNDKISRTRTSIAELRTQINALEQAKKSLVPMYERLADAQKQEREKEAELKRLTALSVLAEKWKTYDASVVALKESEERGNALKKKYPNGLPTAEELETLDACKKEDVRLSGLLQEKSKEKNKFQSKFETLEQAFSSGVPTEEEINAVRENILVERDLSQKVKSLSVDVSDEDFKRLKKVFQGREPSENEIVDTSELVKKYRETKQEIEFKANAITESVPVQTKKGLSPVSIVGAVVALVGLGVLFLNLIVGGVIAVVGAFLFAFGFFVGKSASNAVTLDLKNREELQRLKKDREDFADKIKAFLFLYGYGGDGELPVEYNRFLSDLRQYFDKCKTEETRISALETAKNELSTVSSGLDGFFSPYSFLSHESREKALSRLETGIQNFEMTKADLKKTEEDERNLFLKQKENLQKACGLVAEYGLNPENPFDLFDELKTDRRDTEILSASEEKRKAEMEEKRPNEPRPDEAEIQKTEETQKDLEGINREIARVISEIEELEASVGRLDALNADMAKEEEKLAEYEAHRALLENTEKFLKQAEDRIKNRYVLPVKNVFDKYLKAIETAMGDKMTLDGDFSVTFEANGETRTEKHLSAGQRTALALCFRLALSDNIYKNKEQPFFVMDDPFVNLDENHIQTVSAVVNELAKEKQILYFCCHESRKIQP